MENSEQWQYGMVLFAEIRSWDILEKLEKRMRRTKRREN